MSRVWRKVKADWEAWNARSLAEEPIVRLILDGTWCGSRLDIAQAFLIVDGAPGLEKAIVAIWDGVPVQRCTVHKHRNLLAHAPDRLHDESWGMLRRFRPCGHLRRQGCVQGRSITASRGRAAAPFDP